VAAVVEAEAFVVPARRRWYLIAWDTGRGAWRTFRVDRVTPVVPTGPRFAPRPLPAEDVAAYVSRGVAAAPSRFRARVTVHAPAEAVAERLPSYAGSVEAVDDRTCVVDTGGPSAEMVAVWLGMLGFGFTVDPAAEPELAAHVERLADRYRAATRSGTNG
jgi:predicted DNA-binding transcriptional regulator YafY